MDSGATSRGGVLVLKTTPRHSVQPNNLFLNPEDHRALGALTARPDVLAKTLGYESGLGGGSGIEIGFQV
jgi:hypothetical protein